MRLATEVYVDSAVSDSSAPKPAGEKIQWLLSDGVTVFAEFWAAVTPPGGYAQDHIDSFLTNTLSAWASTFAYEATRHAFYASTSDGTYVGQRSDWGPFDDTKRAEMDYSFTGVSGGCSLAFRKTSNNHDLGIELVYSGSGGIYNIRGMYGAGADRVTIDTVGLASTKAYRLRITRNGNSLDWEVYNYTDGVVAKAGTWAIPAGAPAIELGAGINLDALRFTGTNVSAAQYVDEVRTFEYAAESRDFWVGIHPIGGGARIDRRLFGVTGPTTVRSDFL
jgi:hypothetical protein